MTDNSERWVVIGRLHRARGIRGELVGELDSPDPDRAEKLDEVTLERNGQRSRFRVEQVWGNQSIYKGSPVFKFEGIDTMTDAEKWERAEILVRESDVIRPAEGEYSFAELVGCAVLHLESGEKLGVVDQIEEFGGPLLLKVLGEDGREILIPFARAICRQIDVAAKTIRVVLPEGLLDV